MLSNGDNEEDLEFYENRLISLEDRNKLSNQNSNLNT